MKMEKPKPPSSTVCSLDEAPDAWRGYLTPEEIAAQVGAIAAALEQIGRSDLAARLPGAAEPGGRPVAAADIAAAFDRLLPRISDDRLHATLRAVRDAL
jgi:hypothetical protein